MTFVLMEEGMRFLPFIPAEYVGQRDRSCSGCSSCC